MIIVQYCSISDMVKKRHWFFHCWKLKRNPFSKNWMVPRAYIKFDHHRPKIDFVVRVLGFMFSFLFNFENEIGNRK